MHCWWECKLIQPLWKVVWRFLKKLGIKPPYDPDIPLLGIYPEETMVEKDTCIPLFTAALFTTARTWKQPRCLSTDEWTKKLWYIYTMEYYSAIKRNTFASILMRQMNPEPIIQSEVSQKEKDKHRILMHIYEIQKNGTEEFIYRTAVEKQTQRIDLWTWEGGGEGEMYGKSNMETYITICKIDSQWEFSVWLRKLKKKKKKRGYMYTYG